MPVKCMVAKGLLETLLLPQLANTREVQSLRTLSSVNPDSSVPYNTGAVIFIIMNTICINHYDK